MSYDGSAARMAAIAARDPAADGAFWYSVATTGVYCRPSCPSRHANPRNVRLHDSVDDARASGARACRRCDPDDLGAGAALIERACRTIESSETPPTLAELAAAAGLSDSHFHRLFRQVTGVTPHAYAVQVRSDRLHGALPAEASVTAAAYAAGYGSGGRLYADAPARLGMTPSRYRRGGAGEVLRFAIGQATLGAVLIATSDNGIAAILLGDDAGALSRELQDRFPAATLVGDDAGFAATVAQVVALVDDPSIGGDLPLDIRGTAFQQRVWAALRAIPPGETLSYAELAQAIGAPAAVRAVAGACAANAHAVAIPCHRVVRNDGALSGYRWGVDRKRALLDRERVRRG